MKDDYLWDGSGEPDPEVQRLESALGRFRHSRPAPEFPDRAGLRDRLQSWFFVSQLVAAAVVALVITAAWFVVRQGNDFRPASTGWEVARLAGAPQIGTRVISDNGRLAVGQLLETDSASRARISVGRIGQVEVEPNTRLRLVKARATEDRLALDRGMIHAFISAPPRLFFVDTPSAVAVDLGCAYTLQVNDQGEGLLRVTFGWVEFESNSRESLIPAGAAAVTKPGVGPGTPFFEDASEVFKSSLRTIDFVKDDIQSRAMALGILLTEARQRDAFTLLNLLGQTQGAERGRIYDRLAELVPPPPGVDREQALRADGRIVGLWWDRMGVGHPKRK